MAAQFYDALNPEILPFLIHGFWINARSTTLLAVASYRGYSKNGRVSVAVNGHFSV